MQLILGCKLCQLVIYIVFPEYQQWSNLAIVDLHLEVQQRERVYVEVVALAVHLLLLILDGLTLVGHHVELVLLMMEIRLCSVVSCEMSLVGE